MSDKETVEEIRKIIFEGCPLRELLKKPCPYFGTSESCRDCTYDWMTISDNVRKVVEKRRAAYEKEQAKVKKVTAELVEVERIVDDIGKGWLAFSKIMARVGEAARLEEADSGQAKDKDSEGKAK